MQIVPCTISGSCRRIEGEANQIGDVFPSLHQYTRRGTSWPGKGTYSEADHSFRTILLELITISGVIVLTRVVALLNSINEGGYVIYHKGYGNHAERTLSRWIRPRRRRIVSVHVRGHVRFRNIWAERVDALEASG